MTKITTKQLKDLWIKFFTEKNHVQIPSASLVPDNDGSVLFTTAGMHPIVPYLLGQEHPNGKRLTDYQKCVRTNDIESVGDNSHLTFFEMLGSWSLGDYFKKEIIKYSFEFLTSKDYLNLPVEKLAVSVFEGDENIPFDKEAYDTWKECGIKEENIFVLPKENNWWALGEVGPCGPDSEMFYITDKEKCCDSCSPACDCGRYLEIWNDVFMGYARYEEGGQVKELAQKNVDTGMGLERTVCVVNGYKSVYECDAFADAIKTLESLSGKKYENDNQYTKAFRVICDHIRAATMILGDEIPTTPSNVGRGYVLRRLIRRSVNYGRKLEIDAFDIVKLVDVYVSLFEEYYPSLTKNKSFIIEELTKEIKKFNNTINQGLKEFEKALKKLEGNLLDGNVAFKLYDTFGFPIELTQELAKERGFEVDIDGYNECYKKHQELSRASNTQVFKGGLAGSDFGYAKYHTATHLLHASLRKHFGEQLHQRGSNITLERMRFDFNFDRKLTAEEIKMLENDVNEAISKNIKVEKTEMNVNDAKNSGAIGIFDSKYGDVVSVYTIGDISKEICGGPHAEYTGQLGKFKIVKEESSSAGVRRIKAVLE